VGGAGWVLKKRLAREISVSKKIPSTKSWKRKAREYGQKKDVRLEWGKSQACKNEIKGNLTKKRGKRGSPVEVKKRLERKSPEIKLFPDGSAHFAPKGQNGGDKGSQAVAVFGKGGTHEPGGKRKQQKWGGGPQKKKKNDANTLCHS